jgi:hypothetical protein
LCHREETEATKTVWIRCDGVGELVVGLAYDSRHVKSIWSRIIGDHLH